MKPEFRFSHQGYFIDIERWQARDRTWWFAYWILNERNQMCGCGAHQPTVSDALSAAQEQINTHPYFAAR